MDELIDYAPPDDTEKVHIVDMVQDRVEVPDTFEIGLVGPIAGACPAELIRPGPR